MTTRREGRDIVSYLTAGVHESEPVPPLPGVQYAGPTHSGMPPSAVRYSERR
jgi:hypothetical protein